MKHVYKAFCGALLVLGLAGVTPGPAQAGQRYDSACNCMRPDSSYNTRRVVRGAPIVRTHRRVVNHTRVVRGQTKLIQENRLVVHVRPVINREVVVHRTNTVVRNVVLHRTNTTNKYRTVSGGRQVVHVREGGGSVRHVTEHRRVRGINCNCDYAGGRSYSGGTYGGRVVSYRD
jgi:hypothetical protein